MTVKPARSCLSPSGYMKEIEPRKKRQSVVHSVFGFKFQNASSPIIWLFIHLPVHILLSFQTLTLPPAVPSAQSPHLSPIPSLAAWIFVCLNYTRSRLFTVYIPFAYWAMSLGSFCLQAVTVLGFYCVIMQPLSYLSISGVCSQASFCWSGSLSIKASVSLSSPFVQ